MLAVAIVGAIMLLSADVLLARALITEKPGTEAIVAGAIVFCSVLVAVGFLIRLARMLFRYITS